jgi:Zn-dependent protease with chaperone function
MKYFGLQSQIRKNNTNSVLILLMFPLVFFGLTWLFFFFMSLTKSHYFSAEQGQYNLLPVINNNFLHTIPWITIGVIIWFTIAWLSHSAIINKATGSRPLERKENKRIYNLVENLCISRGMTILIGIVLALVGYLIATLFRFALSRKREYLADSGSAELTKNPLALASALRKISADPTIEAVKRKDVAQMFIENPQAALDKSSFSIGSLFATHPPIKKRIEILEQF